MRTPIDRCSRQRRRPGTARAALVATALLGTLGASALPATAGASARPATSVGGGASPLLAVGGVPAVPAGALRLGPLPGTRALGVDVALVPRHAAGLEALATAVSDPTSPRYRHYLTAPQFAARFGATVQEVATVRSALVAAGLPAGTLSANRLVLRLRASADRLARGLHTAFARFRVGATTAYADTAAPRLPAAAARLVQAVVGLDDLYPARPLGLEAHRRTRAGVGTRRSPDIATGGPQPCDSAVLAGDDYNALTADQLAWMYQFPDLYGAGDFGGGITIGVYELENNLTSDIAAYQSCYGTSTSISYVKVDGGATGSASGEGEAALDIEDVLGLAPRASILVYQGPNDGNGPFDTLDAMVSQDRARVISSSWGVCEPDDGGASAAQAENTVFEEAATQGQTFVAAAGDDGSEACDTDGGNAELAVSDPASQPFVTGVGGTSLYEFSQPPVETVWNDGLGGGAGGGGISTQWTMPTYQSGASGSLGVVNSDSSGTPCSAGSGHYCREVPDVSADADPETGYVIYFQGQWGAIGGTSAAAPLWGAVLTLADWACGGSPIGFANPALYRLAGSNAYSTTLDDVTVGDNDMTGTNDGRYPAKSGYDMASGLGTPMASGITDQLCKEPGVTKIGSATAGNTTATVSWQPPASSGGSAITSYTVSSIPAGASVQVSASSRSATLHGLVNGISYSLQVAASNSYGRGPYSAPSNAVTPVAPEGYWLATAGGDVFGTGAAVASGGVSASSTDPVVGIGQAPDGGGYFVVTRNGTVEAHGDVSFHGDLPGLGIKVDDIVGIAPTSDGKGYWLVGDDGGEFAFGDATYHGSLPGLHIHVSDIVGMVATTSGSGYLMVGRDGGVFAFGAHFWGSLPGIGVKVDDIVGILPAPGETGYILVGADGGTFSFGTGARFYGSLPGEGIHVHDIVGIALTSDARGYWLAGSNGTVYNFGDADSFSAPSGLSSHLPVAAIAGT